MAAKAAGFKEMAATCVNLIERLPAIKPLAGAVL
jgi:hypothetical protein